MSKYQHFFLYALMLTLLAACEFIPQKDAEPIGNTSDQHLYADKLLHLQQDKEVLEVELGLAKKKIQLLETESNQLKAKLDALTAIEHSLHERKQRQSNER